MERWTGGGGEKVCPLAVVIIWSHVLPLAGGSWGCRLLKDELEPIIKASLPDKVSRISFTKLDLGSMPPMITGVKPVSNHLGEFGGSCDAAGCTGKASALDLACVEEAKHRVGQVG